MTPTQFAKVWAFKTLLTEFMLTENHGSPVYIQAARARIIFNMEQRLRAKDLIPSCFRLPAALEQYRVPADH